MRTIYLVRHGKPEFPDEEKRCIGWTDFPLSEEGKGQIEALKDSFGDADIETIYASPLRRCVESANLLSRILSGGKIPVEIVDGLREINMGDWEGLSFSEIRERYPVEYEARGRDMAGFAPPGGESFEDCQKRAWKTFEEIRKKSRGNVILLGHAGFNRTLIAKRENRRLRDLFEIPQEYGGVYPWQERIFDGMIVAAGLSSRMGGFKPLMELGKKKVICREIETLRKGGAREIAVITGHRAKELEAEIAGPGIRFLHNPDYAVTKMFDSVRIGLSYFEEKRKTDGGKSLDGIFFLPVDVPLFTEFTMEYEKYRFEEGTGDVYCPYYGGAPGHPLLIRLSCVPFLLAHNGERGLKGAYERLGERVVPLPVTDRGSVMDADTPEDFGRLETYEMRRKTPDEDTCRELFSWFGTGPDTVRHCEAVARLAKEIGEACNRNGAGLDLELIGSAALIHDLAKGQSDHAAAAADWLSLLGHERTAAVVSDHMELPKEKLTKVNESLVVYLADKKIRGTERVGIEARFAAKRRQFQDNPGALAGLEYRYACAKRAEELAKEKGYQDEIN